MLKKLVAAAVFTALAASPASADDRAVIIEWNQLLQSTMPGNLGLQSPRYFSMLHIAMFDAVNSIERGYAPYVVKVRDAGGSAEAAAAQAGHAVLSALIPGARSTYDTALAARLATIPAGAAQVGAAVGAQAAQAVLAWRQNDGWATTPPAYVLPPFPGLYQPTPPANSAPTFTHFPKVKPFATLSATQFLGDLPPTLTSARYAEDFNEVKAIGAVNSTVRTADQTLVARLWAGAATPTSLWATWNNVARDAASRQGLGLAETARLFVYMNVSMNDALQTTQTGKFVYGLWRPVTAIRRAAEDLNPDTEADASWLPLITTPAYPSYPGNMACVGASAATALAYALGTNDIPTRAVWRNLTGPDYVRDYTSLWQIAVEQAEARVYGGIHYRFDNETSQEACPKVAGWVYANYMHAR